MCAQPRIHFVSVGAGNALETGLAHFLDQQPFARKQGDFGDHANVGDRDIVTDEELAVRRQRLLQSA